MTLRNVVIVADNCDKTAPFIAAFNAGTEHLSNMPEGVAYPVNQNGKIVSTAAIAAVTKSFYIASKNNGKVIKSPNISISGLTNLVGYKPQYFLSERRAIGDITGILTSGFTPVAGRTYGFEVKVDQFKDPEKPEACFSHSVRVPESGTNLKGYLFTNLVERLLNADRANYYLNAYAHTNAAAAASITATIVKDSKVGTYSAGTLTAGMYIAYTGTTTGDSRTQANGVYRVTAVDSANGTFELGHPWQAESISATAVDQVLLDDSDEWGMIIETKRNEFVDTRYPFLIQPQITLTTNDFASNEVLADGDELKGQKERGIWWDVNKFQTDNVAQEHLGIVADSAVKNYYYSNLQLKYFNAEDKSVIEKQHKEGIVEIFIQGPTTAELLAGTAPTYGSNIVTGTSIDDSALGALVNGLNLLAFQAGILNNAVNTVNNGGNGITDGVDI